LLRVREFTDQYLLKHEFLKRLKVRYAREGIEIPFPTIDWAEEHSSFETEVRQRRRA
jgi:small-conductance mechanosensitive channel